MTNGAAIWSGDIVTPKAECGQNRVVLIFRQRPGPDQKVGSTEAKRTAVVALYGYAWVFEKIYAVKASERYYAKVNATDKCAGARSAVLNAVSY